MTRWLALLWLVALALTAGSASAEPLVLERAVARFVAPETGGVRSPRFIFERMLAFEARLEALADPDRNRADSRPYRERHVRSALERHVSETLLASLRIQPEPSRQDVERQTQAARLMLLQQVGGAKALEDAAQAEGLSPREVISVVRRRARASLYLDRMVAPMLEPSEAELVAIHRTVNTPFSGRPFDEIHQALRRWYVGRRLQQALSAFYQNARSRVTVTLL